MGTKKKGPRNERKILNSTIELIDSVGYRQLTIEAIAEKAGVGKSTIYRWWDSKEDVVLDAFLMEMEIQFDFNAKEPLSQGFVNNIKKLTYVLDSSLGKAVVSIVAENEQIAEKFYEKYLEPRRSQAKDILSLAIEKGDIQTNIDLDILLDMLYGPIYLQILVYKRMPSMDYIHALVEEVFSPISTHKK